MSEATIKLSGLSNLEYKNKLFFDALKKMKIKRKDIIEPREFFITKAIQKGDIETLLWVEIYIFDNLTSYLWARYNETDDIMDVYRKIRTHRGKIADISWGFDEKRFPVEDLNPGDKMKLLYIVMKELKGLFQQVLDGKGDFESEKGALITGFPTRKNLQVMYERFGFGKTKKDGWCYSKLNFKNKMVPY